MPISANPTRILKELGDADHLMSVPLVAPSKGYIRHPAEAGFCTGRGSTPKTVTLAAQSLCNGFATLSSLTSSTPVTAAEIFDVMKTNPKSGASYCWLNFDFSKPEDFEASMQKHYHDKTMRGVATKRETVFILRGPNRGTSRAVIAKAASVTAYKTKRETMTVYSGEEMSVLAAAAKKMGVSLVASYDQPSKVNPSVTRREQMLASYDQPSKVNPSVTRREQMPNNNLVRCMELPSSKTECRYCGANWVSIIPGYASLGVKAAQKSRAGHCRSRPCKAAKVAYLQQKK
jgi:hypothetical protein